MKILGTSEQLEQEIINIAIKNQIKRLILFGSRARGDYKRTSDIDLAFSGGNGSLFILELEEDTSTLLQYDLVNLDGMVQAELLESIQNEGIVIYEKI